MNFSEEKFYMVQMYMNVPSLLKFLQKKRFPPHVLDLGYLIHCQLCSIFGDKAPSPFAFWKNSGRNIKLLAFTPFEKKELEEHAKTYSDPAAHNSIIWNDFHQKTMPDKWTSGQQLAFEIRVCPVKRMPRGSLIEKAGSEVDAFIAKCHALNNPEIPVDRESVYKEWLRDRLEKTGAVKLIYARMISFKRERLIRRTNGEQRKTKIIERPNAVFKGAIEIKDSYKFKSLLLKGIGRHRKFGFGMLLLKPMKC